MQNIYSRKVMVFLAWCIFFFALVCVLFKLYLNSYNMFTRVELVAVVECKEKAESKQPFLEVQLCCGKESGEKRVFPFKADEWVIEGRIIRWKKYFNLIGIKNYYRLERISSRYFEIEKEKNLPHIVYSLYDKPDRFWFIIYKMQRFIPFVDAVYGNSAFVSFEPGKVYQVYISNTGFLIKDISVPKKRSWWLVG